MRILGACGNDFVAILYDGSAVMSGCYLGPDDEMNRIQDQLKDVQQICGTAASFAAILSDERVITWGDPKCGGESSSVQEQLVNVQEIKATLGAFVALCGDGRVVAWGDPECGGDCSQV